MDNNNLQITIPAGNTLIDLLKRASLEENRGISFLYNQERKVFLSYAGLYDQALYVLHNMQEQGLQPGNEAVLMLEDNRNFVVFFWACLLGGIIPVPLPAGNQEDHKYKLASVWNTLTNPCLICEHHYYEKLRTSLSKQMAAGLERIEARYLNADKLQEKLRIGHPASLNASGLAYVQFSSGSTGEPKGVSLTHHNLLTNIRDIISRSQTTEEDKSLSWMPLSHDMGLICFHLSSLAAVIDQYIMDTSLFIRNPVLWIEEASRHRISQLYSPNFGYHYFLAAMEGKERKKWDLSAIRIIYNGAEPISHALCNRFYEKLSVYGLAHNAMFAGYGLAEAAVAVSLPEVNETLNVYFLSREYCNKGDKIRFTTVDEGVAFVENGYPLKNCFIRICGDADEVYGDKRIGNIQIKGDNVTGGYYNNTVATRQSFTSDGWLRTGDLGFLYNNRLTVTGRAKHVIIINGQNYYPQDIERIILSSQPSFDLGKVVACGVKDEQGGSERLIVFLLYKGTPEGFIPFVKFVKEVILEKMGLIVHAVVPVRKIPKTTSGKIQHYKLAALYKQGAFSEVGEKLDELIVAADQGTLNAQLPATEKLQLIWTGILGMEPVAVETNLFEEGLNSLVALRFATYIQQILKVDISVSHIFQHPSLSRLAGCMAPLNATILDLVTPLEEQEHYACTDIQQRFWLLQQLDTTTTAYNLQGGFIIDGVLDLDAFKKAVAALVTQYDILHTTFFSNDGVVRQKVKDIYSPGQLVSYVDLRNEYLKDESIDQLVLAFVQQPFDLENGPLLRYGIYQLGDTKNLLFFSVHHIIADGWSVNILTERLKDLYRQFHHGTGAQQYRASVQFHDYCAAIAAPKALEMHQVYWNALLAGDLTGLEFPFAKPRGALQTFSGKAVRNKFSSQQTSAIKDFCRKRNITEFMLLCAVLRSLLFRYTGQTDLVIGTDTAGRIYPGQETQPGCFLNTLPLRVQIGQEETFTSLFQKEKVGLLQALEHQSYPFTRMIEDLQLTSSFSRTPIFNVLFLFRNLEGSYNLEGMDEALHIRPVEIPVVTSMVDLELECLYEGAELSCQFRFNSDLFDECQITRMARHFSASLEQAIATPDEPLTAIALLDAKEKLQLQIQGKGQTRPLLYSSVIQAFEQMVAVQPNAIALKFEDKELTYDDLGRQADTLAHLLVNDRKVRKGSKIGLLMSRTPQMIVAMLAILKAGGIYVPIDPEFPLERITFISEDAGLHLLLTDHHSQQHCTHIDNVIVLTEAINAIPGLSGIFDSGGYINSDDVAYILYTSGSMGQPKGVMISHGSLINYIQTFIQYFKVVPEDRIMQQSSLVFDISLEEMFAALCSGAMLVLSREGGRNIEALLSIIETASVTILSTTPLVIREMNDQVLRISNLRVLISGGDVLKPAYINHLINKVELYNTYGPTETTICVTYNRIASIDDANVIGKPLPEHTIYLLDEQLHPVPTGIPGQIYVSGKGLAKGYVNSALDGQVFIPHPERRKERLYRTGDLGLWTESGEIRFLGRVDTQLKWNGYRIEAGEIEKRIILFEHITDAIVKLSGSGSKQQLTAYLLAAAAPDLDALRAFLIEQLPAYMVPVSFVVLDRFPVNANGKVDMKALPCPGYIADNVILPAGAIEAALLNMWREILKQDNISVLANFFELGGNSLKATQVITRVRKYLKADLSLRDMLTYPVIRSLARRILSADTIMYDDIQFIEQCGYYPLSLSQKRLWMLHQLEELPISYNLCWTFLAKGPEMPARFGKALEAMMERHESLRTGFVDSSGEPFMVVHEMGALGVPLTVLQPSDGLLWQQILEEECRRPFDLQKGPLFRVMLQPVDQQEYRVIFIIHHIISDGWSMEIIWRELNVLLHTYTNTIPPILPPLNVSYKDCISWMGRSLSANGMQRHEGYWQARLKKGVPVFSFPSVPGRSSPIPRGKKIQLPVSHTCMEQLAQIAAGNGTTVFTVLLTIWKIILFKYTGQQEMVITTPVAGRNHPALEDQVGYYLNMLPLMTTFGSGVSFTALLKLIKQTVEEAFEHQEYPVEKLLTSLDIRAEISRHPLFDVMLVYQNFDHLRALLTDDPVLYNMQELDNGTCIGSLLIELGGNEPDLILKLRYDTAVFSEGQIDRLASSFERICSQVYADPDRPLYQYRTYTDIERSRLLDMSGNNDIKAYPYNTITALLNKAFDKYCGRTALLCAGNGLTYKELDIRVNCLAWHMHYRVGIGPGQRVGILLGRSENLVISILAVLKMGAAYVPLDPEYPVDRLNTIIQHSEADLVITETVHGPCHELVRIPVLNLAEVSMDIKQEIAAYIPQVTLQPEDLAYIMYTSGSSGIPKGVKISCAALADYVQTFISYFSLTENDRIIQQSSPAFDVFMEEVFPALSCGAMVLISPEGGRDTEKLAYLIKQYHASILSTTPQVITALNRRPQDLAGLRLLISGGDRLTSSCIDQLYEKLPIYNTYGPTEITVCATYHRVETLEDAGCIGRPVVNKEVYLLDDYLEPVPPGIIGEMYIAGSGLANGYLDLEEETKERFIKHPFKPDKRIYRTGDLGMWDEKGRILFCGRKDNQVKVNGYRIEKAEIENVLLKHDLIRGAQVLYNSVPGQGEELHAYIIAKQEVDIGSLKIWLCKALPFYMIPSKFFLLDVFPLTIHGKTDLVALRAMAARDPGDEPETIWEQRLCRIWEWILDKAPVSRGDNFFSLGGNSIKATLLVNRISEQWQVRLQLKDVFIYPGLQEMAGIIAGIQVETVHQIRPVELQPAYDVSHAQKRIWILSQLGYGQGAYHICTGTRLKGKLDHQLLDQCFEELASRHEILRTTFDTIDGNIRQIVHPAEAFPRNLTYENLQGLAGQQEIVAQYVGELQKTPFDLQNGPLYSIKLLRLEEDIFLLLFAIHHIIADGWSVSLLFKEWEALYLAHKKDKNPSLPVLDFQYKDYACFMNSPAIAGRLALHEHYWKEKFADNIPIPELPLDFPRPRIRSNNGSSSSLLIPARCVNELRTLAVHQEATLFMVLLAALKTLLYRYTGQEDMVIGIPVSGRDFAGLENQLGCYVNTLPLRTVVTGQDTFNELLNKVKDCVLEAFEHQLYPFDQLVAVLQQERDISHSPLFDVMLAMQQDNGPTSFADSGELEAAPFWITTSTSKFDLTLYVYEIGDALQLVLEYNTDLFTVNTINKLLEHYRNLLEQINVAGSIPVYKLDMLGERERSLLLEQLCRSSLLPQEPPVFITDIIADIARQRPYETAIRSGAAVVSYRQLMEEISRIRRYLLQVERLEPNSMIGVMMDRSEKMVAALMGILFSGAAYVPIDPAYPVSRIRHIIDDSAIKTVITEEHYKHHFDSRITSIIISQLPEVMQTDVPVMPAGSNIDDVAYVIYTSGSTGKPKGIPITHRNLWSLISWADTEFCQDKFDIVYAGTSYCFDLSVFEIFFPLSIGKCIRLLTSGIEITDYVGIDNNILINTVPSVMEQLLENSISLSDVNSINLAGEAVSAALVARLVKSGAKIRNLYGPSEDTTYSTCYSFTPQDNHVAIGRPVSGKSVYVLDEYLNLLPVGVKGQICIGGIGLAKGYLNLPELTAEKFIENPYDIGTRLYMTGDVGRWLPDGNLECLGRKDHQLKIRGFRIEPAEIEHVLLQVPGVKNTLVISRIQNTGGSYLCAYYTAERSIGHDEILHYLEQQLPAYMIPYRIVQLEIFPTTPNGKVDRRMLPEPGNMPAGTDDSRLLSPTERVLTNIWMRVLGRENIGISDNWFIIGGHSLNATQVVYSVNRYFSIDLQLKDIFFHPTIEQLAAVIERSSLVFADNIPVQEEQEHYPLSHMQRRLWVLDRLERSSNAYNMSSIYRLEGHLDRMALEQAYITLIMRHESLRTSFAMINGSVRQRVRYNMSEENVIIYHDLRNGSDAEEYALRMATGYLNGSFDPAKGHLLTLVLLQFSADSYFFVVSMHHIISDGWSMNVILREILYNYEHMEDTFNRKGQALEIQYRDFAIWYQNRLETAWGERMREYWMTQLSRPVPVLDFPGAHPRPAVKTYKGSEEHFIIGKDESEMLYGFSANAGVTVFMLLLAALKTLIYRYTGQEDIIIGTPASGRWLPEQEDQVGFYVNTLALRTRLKGTDSFSILLEQVKNNLLTAIDHQHYPFDQLLEELRVKRDLSRSPLFDLMVVYQDIPAGMASEIAGLRWEELAAPSGYSKFDMTVTFIPTKEGIVVKAEYNTDIYSSEWIKQMLGHYNCLLQAIITSPTTHLNRLTYLTAKELEALAGFKGEGSAGAGMTVLTALFEQQVELTPDATAVIFEDKTLSYYQLNKDANQIAALLRINYQVKPGDLVGIMLDRSEGLVAGIIGILKSGAAYVPIDPAYPPERKKYIIENSRLKVLITTASYTGQDQACQYIAIDELASLQEQEVNLPLVNVPSDLAYVIYTSGTTGKPKGVMVEHGAVVNLVVWLHDLIYKAHASPLTVMMNASVSFDSSVKQLFPPLLAGSTLVMVSEQTHKDPKALLTTLDRHKIDVWDITPGYLNYILRYVDAMKHFPAFTLAGGEPLSSSLVDHYNRLLHDRSTLINVYGVTEAAVDSTYCLTNEVAFTYCNIGRPILNTAIYVLDSNCEPLPVGFPGEICIAGNGLARGYLYDEQQTAARFCQNPFGTGMLYRTGDIGKWHADGMLEFMGRSDRQVKIRGCRVELAEVEQVLLRYAGIKEALVKAIQNERQETALAAYFVIDEKADIGSIRHFMQTALPSYMIPDWLVPLASFPLNEHGKINREALPDPRHTTVRARETPIEVESGKEKILLELWENILECKGIGIEDNFFDLGGNSLKLIRLYDAIQEKCPGELEIYQLFSNPTLRKMGALLSSSSGKEKDLRKDINLIEL